MENLEYYQKCLEEFNEAIEAEHLMEHTNDGMIKLLKMEIAFCQDKIKELT